MSEYPAIKCSKCGAERDGAHYNIWNLSKGGVAGLRKIFPDAKANEMNFALFSTSGVHGLYTTIEEIEHSLNKYGASPEFMKDESEADVPDDWAGTSLTVAVYHPRIIGVGYGNVEVTLNDIEFLKTLRESSWKAVRQIGVSSKAAEAPGGQEDDVDWAVISRDSMDYASAAPSERADAREQFEQEFKRLFPRAYLPNWIETESRYFYGEAQMCWEIWQARGAGLSSREGK